MTCKQRSLGQRQLVLELANSCQSRSIATNPRFTPAIEIRRRRMTATTWPPAVERDACEVRAERGGGAGSGTVGDHVTLARV